MAFRQASGRSGTAEFLMPELSRLERSFRQTRAALSDLGAAWAVVGGLAVSARVGPRFTRDIDLAVSVSTDRQAEEVVHGLVSSGYRIELDIEQTGTGRLSTIRLVRPDEPRVFVDLLFAASGIEPEIVECAEAIEVFGVTVRVATLGHLIAMKVLCRDDTARPRDREDLVQLLRAAGAEDLEQARGALELIRERGFHRGRDLASELAQAERDLGKKGR